jgi:hypothetical protein
MCGPGRSFLFPKITKRQTHHRLWRFVYLMKLFVNELEITYRFEILLCRSFRMFPVLPVGRSSF